MNDIQKARDVLTGARNLSSFGGDAYEYRFEKVGADGTGIMWRRNSDPHADPEPEVIAENVHSIDARLFFLLGSPYLHEAIDVVLCQGTFEIASKFAAAILDAEDRVRT